jgi:fructokinase
MSAPILKHNEEAPLIGGIEAGGTKIVCAVAHSPDQPLMEHRFPTRDPKTTLAEAVQFFRDAQLRYGELRAMGIGTFGPADVDQRSPGYGTILTTPKEGWAGTDFLRNIRAGLGTDMPIAFDTDVNVAAIGESEFGAGRHFRNIAYITVGTGIGGGMLLDGVPVHGRMHPEIGHMTMPDLDKDFGKSTNICPFHQSCLEGRASGPALEARWGMPGAQLPEDHPAWELQAAYLAHGAINLTAAWSPDILILGGGVCQQTGLVDRVRRKFFDLAGNYWNLPPLDVYLQTAELGQRAGIVGALAMARRLIHRTEL